MKRILFMLFAVIMSTAVCHAAMSNSKVRKETRFLTDKMAYELNLNTAQYNDVYEINYDFISGVRYLNFFRPIYVSGVHWSFRIYVTYTNPNHFYYPRPYHYRTYCGGHNRVHYHNVSYYRGRHNYPTYNGSFRIRDNKSYHTSRRSDFGSVHIRPNSGTRPNNVEQSNRRPATNSPVRRSDTKKEVNAPKRGQSIQKENESIRRRSNSSSSSTRTTRSSSRSSERGKEASRRN